MPTSDAIGLIEKANGALVTLQGDAVLWADPPPVQPPGAGKLRFEPWTLPTAASFTKADISMPVLDAEGRRELSAFHDCRCEIPDSWTKVATLATHPLVRVFDGDLVIDEFVVERRPRQLRAGSTLDASGPQLGQWGLSRTLVYPPDYGTNPSKRPNWKWGMDNLIDLALTGLGNTSEQWELWLAGERYELDTSLATAGTYTLTVGGNTTAAIDFDASPSTIESQLEGLAGVTDVTVTQPDPNVLEYFVVFENPKDLASNMTITDSTSGGGVVLTKLNDGFDTGTSPTFTITVDGQTTSALPWNASANTVEGSATAGTGLQALPNVSDVSVDGSGTFDDPWVITFHNPADIDSFTVTFAAGTAVATRTVAGGYSADPVTISKPIDEGTGPEEVHGAYRIPAIEVNTTIVDTGADYSVQVNANGIFAGSQIVLNVEPGEIYQASIRLRPAANGSYVLVVHDEYQNQIARTADTPLTAGSFQELSLSDILIPDGVERVIMRVAVVSVTGSTANQYVNWQGARFVSGLEETNPGDIVKTILTHSQAQGDGAWIDPSFDESNDSGGTPWAQTYSYQADGFAMHLLHVLEDMRDLGCEFTLTPKATPSGSLTHDLNLWMPGGAGTDRTVTGPSLFTGGPVVDGEVVDRIPDFTAAVAWGADDLYLEDEDASAVATYGRLTRMVDVERHGNEATLQDALDAAFADEAINRQAGKVMLSGSGSVVPFVHFDVGDTLVWQAADRMAKNDRRVQTVTWKHGDPVASYEVQGSRVWSDPMAAVAEGLRRLMDAPRKRRRFDPTLGIDRDANRDGGGIPDVVLAATDTKYPDDADLRSDAFASDDEMFLAAVAMLPPEGGWIHFLEGSYEFADGAFLDRSGGPQNVKITGAGQGATTITVADSAAIVAVFWIGGTQEELHVIDRLTISDLTIDGNKANGTSVSRGLVSGSFGSGAEVFLERLELRNSPAVGVGSEGAVGRSLNHWYLTDCEIHHNAGNGLALAESRSTLKGCEIHSNGGNGVAGQYGGLHRLSGCWIHSNTGSAINGEGLTASGVAFVIGVSVLDSNGSGVIVGDLGGACVIVANYITNNTGAAIDVPVDSITGPNYIAGNGDNTPDPAPPGEVGPGDIPQTSGQVVTFSHAGTLVTGTGASKFVAPRAGTIVGIRAAVGTAPTGADVIVDVNKNGGTIYTTQANRPTVAAGSATGSETVPDTSALTDGDYLTVDVDQIGSTVAGVDLTVMVDIAWELTPGA